MSSKLDFLAYAQICDKERMIGNVPLPTWLLIWRLASKVSLSVLLRSRPKRISKMWVQLIHINRRELNLLGISGIELNLRGRLVNVVDIDIANIDNSFLQGFAEEFPRMKGEIFSHGRADISLLSSSFGAIPASIAKAKLDIQAIVDLVKASSPSWRSSRLSRCADAIVQPDWR
jgi:hypothetical protein